MLKQIEIDKVPKPYSKSLQLKRVNFFTSYLSSFERISPIDIIKSENTLQVIITLLYSYNNSETPAIISFPKESTNIEILNTPLVQMVPSIFKYYHFIINENKVIELYVKELRDETKEAFRILKDEKKIDSCLDKLIRNSNNNDHETVNIKAFQITNIESIIDSEKIAKVLYNKLFMYLLSQSVRYNGYFGINFPNWSKEEIENENDFILLASLFNRVCIIGSGEEWNSTHLIVSEPHEYIINCINNNS
ncbi:hypothetical protein [Desulfosporosinus hippei]|uniref:Uncharacterized protein n=1 Tax=Desulfosporosinus hippei DSM 8344 TaxID=1121419 RepID=A0A1G8EAP3_9FIRM|nr:hypothetical protein [Desulfosporosinus hippei]SDH66800.1 hypothetical protein SAMN05443529_116101 [Desulfosporosinus hippei DSM 8344]